MDWILDNTINDSVKLSCVSFISESTCKDWFQIVTNKQTGRSHAVYLQMALRVLDPLAFDVFNI